MSEAKRSPRRTVNPSDVTRKSGELEIAWMLGARGDGRAMGGCNLWVSDDEVAVAKSKQKTQGVPRRKSAAPVWQLLRCALGVVRETLWGETPEPEIYFFFLSSSRRAR